MGDDMVSLPKRGDRVRVTEALDLHALQPGNEVTLTGNALVWDEDWVHFDYATPYVDKRWSGAVKVAVLERAIHPSHVEPGGGDAPLCPACGESAGMREPCRGHSTEYARGMRRAVEIAESLSLLSSGVHDRIVPLYELKDAIEKELK